MTRISTDHRRSLKQTDTEMLVALAPAPAVISENAQTGMLKNMIPDPG